MARPGLWPQQEHDHATCAASSAQPRWYGGGRAQGWGGRNVREAGVWVCVARPGSARHNAPELAGGAWLWKALGFRWYVHRMRLDSLSGPPSRRGIRSNRLSSPRMGQGGHASAHHNARLRRATYGPRRACDVQARRAGGGHGRAGRGRACAAEGRCGVALTYGAQIS